MKDSQLLQTIEDISFLYAKDIGEVQTDLENRLMFERQQSSGVFANLPKKTNMQGLTLQQRWDLYVSLMRDWMHFQTRCIVPVCRTVTIAKQLERHISKEVQEVALKLVNGESLKHRVSRSVLKNLTSRKLRDDPLLWDWNVHHFHLGDFDHDKGYAKGTDELLFAYVDQNSAVLLGLGTHADFSARWIFDRLFETNPEFIERFRLKSVRGLSRKVSDKEHRKLLKAQVNVPMMYKGHVMFPPGQGVMTSGHACRIVRSQDQILDAISDFDKNNLICLNNYAPIKMKFNGVCLELWNNTGRIWQGRPLT